MAGPARFSVTDIRAQANAGQARKRPDLTVQVCAQ